MARSALRCMNGYLSILLYKLSMNVQEDIMTRKGRIILFTSSIVVIGIIISIIVTINLLNKELHSLATAEITNVDLSLVPDGVFDGQYSTLPVSADRKSVV